MSEWLKQNIVALVLAAASLTGSAVVGGRVLGHLDAVAATTQRLERELGKVADDVTALRERTSALDERTRTR
jgi:outer membrane murein-binding lipoprotein Lpp